MRLGAHVSIAGSLDLAIDRASAIGCECLQIFYGSPRRWRTVIYPDEGLDRFVDKRRRAHLDPLVAHGSYLVNLGASNRTYHRKSIDSLVATVRGVERLDGLGAVTHLGSRMDSPRSAALRRVAGSVRTILEATDRAMVILEHSAGAGGSLGAAFDDLQEMLGLLHGGPRVGICLDTAHLFAAGWDLRTPPGVDAMVAAVDRAIGWGRVRLLHLNDSVGGLGSHVDRHQNIGEGWIGTDGFRAIIGHPRIRPLPGIIETPGFDHKGPDRKNLARLRRLQGIGRRAAPKEGMHGRRPIR